MDWDINYSLQNCLLTVCVAIFIPVFLVKNQTITAKVKKYFYFLVAALVVEGLESYIDHVLGLVADNRNLTFRIFVSAVGYSWKCGPTLSENCKMTKTIRFENWDHWVERNREGMGYEYSASRKGNEISIKLSCELDVVLGRMQLPEDFDRDVYFAISGEHCSIQTL